LSRIGSIWAILFWLGGIHAAEGQSFGADLPTGFPPPVVPADNPLTEAKTELGRYLFFDTRLSADGTFACSTCHQPNHAFTDTRQRAIGIFGETHPRNTMALANVAYNASLNWADPGLRRLEEQMEIPMFSVKPVEMGISGHEQEVLARLLREPRYGALFYAAFPGESAPADMGRFRAPTLRNIALTAPYMHDGSLPTLEAVIEHYAAGGRAASNPLKSPLVGGFEISAAETRDLVSFLESLTDRAFLEDPRFENPWAAP